MSQENQGTLAIKVRGVPFPIVFADWTHDRLYHTVEFEGLDAVELLAFSGARGQPIPGGTRTLTEVDTNLVRSGDTGLQDGWEALVYSIQVEVVREMGTTAASFALQDTNGTQLSRPTHTGGYDPTYTAGGVLFDFLRKCFFRFEVNQKVKSEGPAAEYPQGSGISVFGTTSALEVANNGPPSPRDQSAFVLPIWIQPQINYRGILKPSAAFGVTGVAGTVTGYNNWTGLQAVRMGFDVRVTLEGLIRRPVV